MTVLPFISITPGPTVTIFILPFSDQVNIVAVPADVVSVASCLNSGLPDNCF